MVVNKSKTKGQIQKEITDILSKDGQKKMLKQMASAPVRSLSRKELKKASEEVNNDKD
jgi:uncharacterized membrane protein YheB (UPF0754 family)